MGQSLLEQALAKKESVAYPMALQLLRKAKAETPGTDVRTQLEINHEFADIFLTLATFDSAAHYLEIPAHWEDLDLQQFGLQLTQRYYLLARWAMGQKNYSLGESYLQKTESLFPDFLPGLFPDIQLKRVRLEIALGKYSDARNRLDSLGNKVDGFSIRQKGDYYFEKGFYHQLYKKFDRSLEALLKAEAYYGSSLAPMHPSIGLTHTFLSYTYRGQYKLKESISSIKKALNIQEQILGFRHPHLATTYYYYATTLNMVGDFASAAKYTEQAIRVYKNSLGNKGFSIGNYYSSLGYAKRGMNQFVEAEDAYKQALKYYLGPPVFPQIDKPYYNYSLTLLANKNYEEGLVYLNKALEARSKKYGEKHPLLLNIYRAFGACYTSLGQYAKAHKYFDLCLEIETQNPEQKPARIADYFYNKGVLERLKKNIQKAFDFQLQALKAMDLDLSAEKLDNLDITEHGRPSLLMDIFLEVGIDLTALAEKSKNPFAEKERALQVYLQCDHFIDERRLSFLSEETKLSLAGTARSIYEKGIELAFDLYQGKNDSSYLETAFYFSGKSKSLLLLLGLKESFALQSAGIPQALMEREWELELKIANKKSERYQLRLQTSTGQEEKGATLDQELFHLEKSKDSLLSILEHSYPDYFQLKYDLGLPSVQDLQGRLPENMNLVDYFWGENDLYIFFLNKDKIEGHRSSGADSLKRKLSLFKELINSPWTDKEGADLERNRKQFADLSQFLYKKLLGPVNFSTTEGLQRLKIIADGGLGFLNFGLLMADTTDTSASYRDLPYLLRDFEISYAYSVGQWWHVLQKGSIPLTGKDDLLAFRPEYPEIEELKNLEIASRKGFGPLYYSKEEIDNISGYFDSQVFEGEKATEKSFYQLAPQFPLIQISGHAMIPDSTPHAAFIAFTDVNSSQFDDSLMLEELYALRLNAEMVVLSACETGIGELFSGEGIMSLGRGFTYAGARSLVMSLWEVNDASTAQIMSSLYSYLSEGQNKDAALRQAQLDYLNRSDQLHAHPYFWAAFVATGDMRAMEIPGSRWKASYILSAFLLIVGMVWIIYTWNQRPLDIHRGPENKQSLYR